MTENTFPIHAVMALLKVCVQEWPQPLIEQMKAREQTPYRILIATLLSLRTRDSTTAQVTNKLFALADTPAKMINLSLLQIEQVIYPVGFYRNKAKNISTLSRMMLERFNGQVPAELELLLTLPGVGRKTANLVLTAGFGLPGICVDTHVHRISNRWGYVQTKTPDSTELALREILPRSYWLDYNKYLVTLGQTICRPTSPRCNRCPLTELCSKIEVTRHR